MDTFADEGTPKVYYLSCHGLNPRETKDRFETKVGFYADFGQPLETSAGFLAMKTNLKPLYIFGKDTANPCVPNLDLVEFSAARKDTQRVVLGENGPQVLGTEGNPTLHAFIRSFEGRYGKNNELRVAACASDTALSVNPAQTVARTAPPKGWSAEDANSDARKRLVTMAEENKNKDQKLLQLLKESWPRAAKYIEEMPREECAMAGNRHILRFPVLFVRAPEPGDNIASCTEFLNSLTGGGTEETESFTRSLKLTLDEFPGATAFFLRYCERIKTALQRASGNQFRGIHELPAWQQFMSVASTTPALQAMYQLWDEKASRLRQEQLQQRLRGKRSTILDEEIEEEGQLESSEEGDSEESTNRNQEIVQIARIAGRQIARQIMSDSPPRAPQGGGGGRYARRHEPYPTSGNPNQRRTSGNPDQDPTSGNPDQDPTSGDW
jgi:hypothetical protein